MKELPSSTAAVPGLLSQEGRRTTAFSSTFAFIALSWASRAHHKEALEVIPIASVLLDGAHPIQLSSFYLLKLLKVAQRATLSSASYHKERALHCPQGNHTPHRGRAGLSPREFAATCTQDMGVRTQSSCGLAERPHSVAQISYAQIESSKITDPTLG